MATTDPVIDSGQIVIEDTIIAACDLWMGVSVNSTEILKMLNEVFKSDEAKAALDKLQNHGLIEAVQKHNKGEKYFEDLVKVVGTLTCEAKMPKVLVISNEIDRKVFRHLEPYRIRYPGNE